MAKLSILLFTKRRFDAILDFDGKNASKTHKNPNNPNIQNAQPCLAHGIADLTQCAIIDHQPFSESR
jgi:hypothetical protein